MLFATSKKKTFVKPNLLDIRDFNIDKCCFMKPNEGKEAISNTDLGNLSPSPSLHFLLKTLLNIPSLTSQTTICSLSIIKLKKKYQRSTGRTAYPKRKQSSLKLGLYNLIKSIKNNVLLDPDAREEFHLLTKQFVVEHARKYKYLHIGCFQVTIKTLVIEGLNVSILMCIRDIRHNDFHDSLIWTIETSPGHGSIYFNCFPNKIVSLLDRNTLDSLFSNTSLHDLNLKEGFIPKSLLYNVKSQIKYVFSS